MCVSSDGLREGGREERRVKVRMARYPEQSECQPVERVELPDYSG